MAQIDYPHHFIAPDADHLDGDALVLVNGFVQPLGRRQAPAERERLANKGMPALQPME